MPITALRMIWRSACCSATWPLARQHTQHHILVIGKADKLVEKNDVIARKREGVRPDGGSAGNAALGGEPRRGKRHKLAEFRADPVLFGL